MVVSYLIMKALSFLQIKYFCQKDLQWLTLQSELSLLRLYNISTGHYQSSSGFKKTISVTAFYIS